MHKARQGQSFKQSLTGLNPKFAIFERSCHTKFREPSLPNFLLIAGRRIVGFISFPRILALCEMQTASLRFELESPRRFPMTLTITQRAPPTMYIIISDNRHG